MKFKGAGQEKKALIAELLAGEIARSLGLKVPEIVFAELDPILSRTEADEEIQDLIKFSGGLNLGLHYLAGAITFDPLVTTLGARLSSQIAWLDALVANVDRTPKNTNMLMWHKELWLIDHGAAFYFHHAAADIAQEGKRAFPLIKDHVLLHMASEMEMVEKLFRDIFCREKIASIASLIPEEWLTGEGSEKSILEQRDSYAHFLETRVASSEIFVKEVQHAREAIV